MTNWRKEGWNNPYKVAQREIETNAAYEDGADAMLEALFELAKESPTGVFEIDSNHLAIYQGVRVVGDAPAASKETKKQ